MVLRDARRDSGHIGLRLGHRHPGLHPRHYFQIMIAATSQLLRRQRQRYPQTHVALEELKTGGHHADDGVLLAVELNVAIYDLRIATVARLPKLRSEEHTSE